MRQPLEDRIITISRAKSTCDYPASFMLIASMNPCPCGFHNHPEKECMCSPGMVQKYLNRISGPLLDRIDIHIEVVPVKYDKLSDAGTIEKSRGCPGKSHKGKGSAGQSVCFCQGCLFKCPDVAGQCKENSATLMKQVEDF